MITVLFVLLLLLLFLSVPVAFAIGLSTVLTMTFMADIPLQVTVQRMFQSINSFPLLAVPLFILAGALMSSAGISKRLVSLAQAFVGHIIGGYAAVTVLASMFFGAISGSSAATVAAIGAILIPAMISRGYSRRFAASTQAVSGELGVIIPPSIPMILYGVATGTSVGTLFIAGILPGILLALILILFVCIISKRQGFKGEDRVPWKGRWAAFKDSFFAIIMPVIILGGIYGGVFTPTEAAAVAVFYSLIVGFFIYKEMKVKDLIPIFGDAAMTTATVMIIISSVGIFSWFLTQNQVPQQAAAFVTSLTSSPIVFLLIINIFLLIVGMFVEASAAILVLAPILLPIATTFGIDPVHLGIIMIINLAIGMVTPPVGVNLFISCKIADISLIEITKGVAPFILLLIIFVLVLSFIPFISLWLPSLGAS